MKTLARLVPPLCAFLFTGALLAQSTNEPRQPQEGAGIEMINSIFIPSLPNAPFTATVRTEWIRPLTDGSTLTWKNHRAVARDSAGRIYQERRMFVPDDSKGETRLRQIEITDPVSREFYVCNPPESACRLREFSRPNSESPVPIAGGGKGTGSADVEDLGKQTIGGLEVIGVRETVVTPTGAIGNNSPLLSRREFWYSSKLGVDLISKREDARLGARNFQVTDIILGDPDPKLFHVPAGYKVIDLRKAPEIPAATAESESPN